MTIDIGNNISFDDEHSSQVTTLIQQEVRRLMQEQQRDLLRTAAYNSWAIVTRELQANTSQVIDTLDTELEKVYEHDAKWKNNINKTNFDFVKQVDDLWEKTERAVHYGRVDHTRELIVTGKTLS